MLEQDIRESYTLFILFATSAFRKLSSIYVISYFPFGFEGRIWDLIVSVPDHCLSFYFKRKLNSKQQTPPIYFNLIQTFFMLILDLSAVP